MNPSVPAFVPLSRALKTLRNILDDALYRGSFYLLANTVTTSAIGFVFWTLAAHRYSAPAVGAFSSVLSGAGLLAAVAALGLPITMTRHIAGAENPRELVFAAVTIIATVGTVLCLATILFLGSHLPRQLHIQQHGGMAFLVTILVVFIAVGGALDAGLVAMRSSRLVLIKNVAGSIVKLVAMLLLTALRSSGLLISFGLGLVLATGLSGVALGWQTRGKRIGFRSFHAPWHYLSITSGNYPATVIGILPLTIVPIEVLAVRGAAETARFSIAFLIAGFLNFIPLTTGQVLFAEISRGEAPQGKQLRKAIRAVYGLLVPSVTLLLAAAPFVLRLFGAAYAADATGCLRILALSALPAGGAYLVDSILIARDRIAAYTFMQVANAGLVLGWVGILLPRGLTAAAAGWALAQSLTLILGLLVVATGRKGRHHPVTGTTPAGKAPPQPQDELRAQPVVNALEPQIREPQATWPTIPTTLIAERIGWDQSIHILLDRVSELRLTYSHQNQHVDPGRHLPDARHTVPTVRLPGVRIAVIIPAGPRDDVLDTLASVVHYTGPSRVIILVDDTSALGHSVGRGGDLWADTVVIAAPPGAPGSLGGLWVKVAAGYRWVLERYEPRMVLRLDADALLIGHGLESRVEQALASNPAVGLLGSYRIGPDGGSRDSSWAARQLGAETGLRGILHPRCRSSLRHCLDLARHHGYIDGESALGGAYIHRYEAAERIYRHGWFSQPWLASSKLGEDHIMSLLTMAAGYRIGDFGGPADPMALKWQGLPAHPADLLTAGKLVIHSVRSWRDLSERQIRDIFARARAQDESMNSTRSSEDPK